jgi:hypothetical protein
MARPESSPSLLDLTERSHKRHRIYYEQPMYVVLYKGLPIKYRRDRNAYEAQPVAKYVRTFVPNKELAQSKADTLNKLFHTKDFTVGAYSNDAIRED